MENLAKELGKNIRNARKERGYSQDVFALACKVDRSYMGRIERGEVNITIDKLYQIADCLNLNPCTLLPNKRK